MVPPRAPLRGDVSPPGDKSISHRAFLLNALATGVARVTGANPGADVASTRDALRALGVRITEADGGWEIHGRGGRLRPATDAIDCGNSGTTLRLLAGILAAQPFTTTLDGDASLAARPMRRIADPLRRMGARVEGPSNGERCPLILTGGPLSGGTYELPMASAQVKSCVLLAAQTAGVEVTVREPGASRDHTERMLATMGAGIHADSGAVRLRPAPLTALDVAVPADPSSAALVAAAAAVVPGSQVRFPAVLVNPTRAGFLEILRDMGVGVQVVPQADRGPEPIAAVTITAPDRLQAAGIGAAQIPGLVDEIPALAVVAAFASGTSRFEGLAELRVKESDRVAAVEDLLRAVGVQVSSGDDWLEIQGGSPRRPERLTPADDHRMVMAACALAHGATGEGGAVEGVPVIAVSYPGFPQTLEALRS